MAETRIKTFCRLCEVDCGLEATVDDGQRISALRPDKTHPVSAGFACHKGLLALEVHRDPDRLNAPEHQAVPGEFSPASWDAAIGDIATCLRALLDQHGPESIAIYMGNPSAFNALGAVAAGIFAQADPGVNINLLSPSGAGSFDPVSGMEHLTGFAVEVLPS